MVGIKLYLYKNITSPSNWKKLATIALTIATLIIALRYNSINIQEIQGPIQEIQKPIQEILMLPAPILKPSNILMLPAPISELSNILTEEDNEIIRSHIMFFINKVKTTALNSAGLFVLDKTGVLGAIKKVSKVGEYYYNYKYGNKINPII